MSCPCGLGLDYEDAGPDGLARGERLLLWGLRTWGALRLQGRPAEGVIRAVLAHNASQRTAALFMQTMLLVESDLVRPLQLQCPHCAGYAVDEQRLVAACGLAAAEPAMAARLLAPMVSRPEVAVALARALNHALALDGAPLPLRTDHPIRQASPAPTLH